MPHSNLDSQLLALLNDENNGSDQEMDVTSSRNRTKSGTGSGAHHGNSLTNGHGSGGASSRDDTPSGSQHAGGGRAVEVDEEDEDDEDEEEEEEDVRHSSSRRSSKKRSSKRSGGRSEKKRRRIRSATDLSAEIDEEDEEDENPYPLEGMFRDEDDRERLMQMNELQREAELEGRREEIKRLTDRLALKKLLEKQQGGPGAGTTSSRRAATKPRSRPPRRSRAASDDESDDDAEEEDEDDEDDDEADYSSSRRGARSSIASAAKSRKRSSVGASSTKATALNNLVQRRKELARGVRAGLDDEDDDFHVGTKVVGSSDEDAEDSDAYEEARSGRSKRGKRGFSSGGRADADDHKTGKKDGSKKSPWSGSKEPPAQRLLGLCQLTRDAVGEMLHRPEWLAHLPGNYVRFQWQPEKNERGETVAPVRIHEILEAKLDASYYEIAPGKPCNLHLRLEWGERSRWVKADAISNRPFHESEYNRWVIRLKGHGLKYPSKDELDGQQLKMDHFNSHRLAESEIQAIVDAKSEAKKNFREKKEKLAKANASQEGTPNAHSQSQASVSDAGTSQNGVKVPPLPSSGTSALTDSNGAPGGINAAAVSHYDQATMAAMNERNRRADRERIKDAERRQAAAKRAAMGLAPSGPIAAAPGGRFAPVSSSGMGTPVKTESLSRSSTPAPAALATTVPSVAVTKGQKGATNVVLSLDVDLGDF
ncbi:RNA polymerase-associated protein rtf1 [Tilletia horrida]|uniref:RNA polymerase-associated protein rtf1 n=1 Tax=Tilletia horrida TaxID=155126 RepID=A0AAN6GMG8_9BASI|nr:RNA polymerase-associated protein rtf1 [Tilletia horrida]KAK0568951.1 RNA polymerase-associated protein rtf1 [Tilletia horrida]